MAQANKVTPESFVKCDEGEIRYRVNENKKVIEISYRPEGESKWTGVGNFSYDADTIKEHNGRIKDTFKGTKNLFPSWVYRETLGRTHQDIRNAIASSIRKQEKAIEREAEKAQKAKEKADKKRAKEAEKAAAEPVEEAPEVDEEDEVDELLEEAKAELNTED